MKRSALPEIAAVLHRRHEAEGVTFHIGCKVAALVGDVQVNGVALEDGRVIPADIVMVGIGVRPDLRWLEGSGLETHRGVRVDESCRSSADNVYAAGDVAELRHPLLDGWQVLESVQNAVSQGKIVAANIIGKNETYSEAPWFWSEQYDCRLQMAGIPRTGDRLVRRINTETDGLSVFSLSGSRLSAVQSINSPRDYMAGRQLITHQVDVSENALADHRYNLKDLL